jgi:hypothetical protein
VPTLVVDVEAHPTRAGIPRDELAEKVKLTNKPLSGLELAHWLTKNGLAIERRGWLTPTRRGLELAAGLVEFG